MSSAEGCKTKLKILQIIENGLKKGRIEIPIDSERNEKVESRSRV